MTFVKRINMTRIVLVLILTLLILSFYATQLKNQSGNASLIKGMESRIAMNMNRLSDGVRRENSIYDKGATLKDRNDVSKTQSFTEMTKQVGEANGTEIAPWLATARSKPKFIVRTCSSMARISHLNDMCERIHGRLKKEHAYSLLVEDGRPNSRTAGCIPWKTGTNSWTEYMKQGIYKLGNKTIPVNYCQATLDRCDPSNSPLRRVVKLTKEQLVAANYFRYVIVRHPLQRLVSAYFEEYAQKPITKADGSKMSFPEYANAITSDLIDGDPHWERYTTFCALCDMGYDFVVRTETEASDVASFNNMNGLPENLTIKHIHLGNAEELQDLQSEYKYDAMLYSLQKEHPALMRRLLDTYRDDMELLGYHWDWEHGESSCWIKYDGDICC